MKHPQLLLLFSLVLLLAATPVLADRTSANEAIIRADSVLAAAERAGAGEHASNYMTFSRESLRDARAAFDRRRWDESERLAIRAQADVELADAISRAARSERNADALRRTVDTLRTELGQDGVRGS